MSCENCEEGSLLPGKPTGSMVGTAYLAAGPAGNTSRAIVLLTDAFGLPLKNNKILADNLATRLSCDVWVPDLFNGEPILPPDALRGVMPERAGIGLSFVGKLRLVAKMIPRLGLLYRNRPSVVDPKINSFIEKLRAEKKYAKIGAVGYCFGGSCAIRLGATSIVETIVICHPGLCTVQQFDAIKIPSSWACAEEDMSFGPELRRQAEASLAARKDKLAYEFRDYAGTVHGFAARPDLTIPEVKAGYEGAFEQTVAWFEKTLPV